MADVIKIYDSLSRGKKGLPDPKKQRKIKLFVCGPTVYDYAHIGHARTYILFDFFAKYLRRIGYDVEYIQNITDIEDKIIKRAEEEGKKTEEISDFYTKAYYEDMKTLGVDAVTKYAPATDFIKEITEQVERLIENGYAYKIDGDGWYFDISKFPDYGKLSGRTAEQAEDAVSRIDEAVGKRNKGDFCLWKFSKEGEPIWRSDLGDGRPGWHIEDTAITEKYFGPQYDIHGGGVDLKFPHHEAEIAQQESVSGLKPFVKIWIHVGSLLVNGKKMSKSSGNFITIRDFLKKYPPEILRFMVLSHNYRNPMEYNPFTKLKTSELINLGEVYSLGWKSLTRNLAQMLFTHKNSVDEDRLDKNQEARKILLERIEKIKKDFEDALADDLNTTEAISNIWTYTSAVRLLAQPDKKIAEDCYKWTKEKLEILGFPIKPIEIPPKIKKLAAEREQFRVHKQFDKSDALRKEIDSLGYEIEDTPQGPFIWPKNPR